MTALYRAVVAFLVLKLANLIVNVVRFPVLRRDDAAGNGNVVDGSVADGAFGPGSDRGGGAPARVSLLIPVRDEADLLARTLPGLLAQDVDEVLLLDDGSSDGSERILARGTRDHPSARVLAGAPRPPAWTGKTWALAPTCRARVR